MQIPRFHLFEIEDQPWCPAFVRDLATDYLRVVETAIGIHHPIVSLVSQTLRLTGATRVIDLCSGAGGPALALQSLLASRGLRIPFTLTDRFPNLKAFQWTAMQTDQEIGFVTTPVDARAVPSELVGFRTLFNSFHHFQPGDALTILRDAADREQPIGIFEICERALQAVAAMLLVNPLMVALVTPFIRPFSLSRLFWTYVMPVVPFICWWDGIVSQLRSYTAKELIQLAKSAKAKNYSWRVGRLPIPSVAGSVTYLIGYPRP